MATGPDPAVAQVRAAVRRWLSEHAPGVPVLVACSGGADSLALAAAVVHEAGRPVRALVVDHQLQPGSAEVAARAAAQARRLGCTDATMLPVRVVGAGGVEAAARRVRYDALRRAAGPDGVVLLGHTLDDQAETVLLGLGRGSGARSLAGMRSFDAPWGRPLLGVRRESTVAACAALGLHPHHDPHNDDPTFTRVRLRHEVLPLLEEVLAGGVAQALARTAAQLREDGDALDDAAARALTDALCGADLDAAGLAGHPSAVRRRVLRTWLTAHGATALTDAQLRWADELVGRWRGQGGVSVGGGLVVARRRGRLTVAGPAPTRSLRPPLPDDQGATAVSEGTTTQPGVRPGDVHPGEVHSGDVYPGDIATVLLTADQIRDRTAELAAAIAAAEPADPVDDLILVGVLKGAVMFMTDLARALPVPVQLEFMAVSSYGSSTSSSGVVRILKDLDRDIAGRRVLIVEDIIDSGLTLSWLMRNLSTRNPVSLQVCALLRKPDAVQVDVEVAHVGFDIPDEFVVGYGLDYAERYRDVPYIGTLEPRVYTG